MRRSARQRADQTVARSLGWDGTGNPLEELSEPETQLASPTSTLAAAADGPAALPSSSRTLASLNVSLDAAPEVKTLSLSEVSAVDNADPADEAKGVEVSPVSRTEGSTEGATGQAVREVPKADADKAGSTKLKPAAKPKKVADSVGTKVNSTAKKIRDGLKGGFSKPAKKTSVAGSQKGAGSAGAGAASSGGDSDK